MKHRLQHLNKHPKSGQTPLSRQQTANHGLAFSSSQISVKFFNKEKDKSSQNLRKNTITVLPIDLHDTQRDPLIQRQSMSASRGLPKPPSLKMIVTTEQIKKLQRGSAGRNKKVEENLRISTLAQSKSSGQMKQSFPYHQDHFHTALSGQIGTQHSQVLLQEQKFQHQQNFLTNFTGANMEKLLQPSKDLNTKSSAASMRSKVKQPKLSVNETKDFRNRLNSVGKQGTGNRNLTNFGLGESSICQSEGTIGLDIQTLQRASTADKPDLQLAENQKSSAALYNSYSDRMQPVGTLSQFKLTSGKPSPSNFLINNIKGPIKKEPKETKDGINIKDDQEDETINLRLVTSRDNDDMFKFHSKPHKETQENRKSVGGLTGTQASITQRKHNRNHRSSTPERYDESNIFTPDAPKEEITDGNSQKFVQKLVKTANYKKNERVVMSGFHRPASLASASIKIRQFMPESSKILDVTKYAERFAQTQNKHKNKMAAYASLDSVEFLMKTDNHSRMALAQPRLVTVQPQKDATQSRNFLLKSQLAIRSHTNLPHGVINMPKQLEGHSNVQHQAKSQVKSATASPNGAKEELQAEHIKKKNQIMTKNNFSILSSQRNRKHFAGQQLTQGILNQISPKMMFGAMSQNLNLKTQMASTFLNIQNGQSRQVLAPLTDRKVFDASHTAVDLKKSSYALSNKIEVAPSKIWTHGGSRQRLSPHMSRSPVGEINAGLKIIEKIKGIESGRRFCSPRCKSGLKSNQIKSVSPENEQNSYILTKGVTVVVPEIDSASEPIRQATDRSGESTLGNTFRNERRKRYFKSGSQSHQEEKVQNDTAGDHSVSSDQKLTEKLASSSILKGVKRYTAKYQPKLKNPNASGPFSPKNERIESSQNISSSNIFEMANTRHKATELSDQNIYQNPVSPKSSQLKKVQKMGQKNKIYKQEINSAGQSIGELKSNVTTQENQLSGQKSRQTPEGEGKQSITQKPSEVLREDLEIVSETNEFNRSFRESAIKPVQPDTPTLNPLSLLTGRKQRKNSDILIFPATAEKEDRPSSAKYSTGLIVEANKLTFGKGQTLNLTKKTTAQKIRDDAIKELIGSQVDSSQAVNLDYLMPEEELRLKNKPKQSDDKRKQFKMTQSRSLADFNFTKSSLLKERGQIINLQQIGLTESNKNLQKSGSPTVEEEEETISEEGETKSNFKSLAKNAQVQHLHFQKNAQNDLKTEMIANEVTDNKKSSKSRRSAFTQGSARTLPVNFAIMSEQIPDFVETQKATGDKIINAVHLLREKFQPRDAAATQANKTKKYNDEVQKWFTDIERFRNVIGGRQNLKDFIRKLSEEGGTGQIYEIQNKKKKQRNERKVNDYMLRKDVATVSAYEMTTTKYANYSSTIYFLLDIYDSSVKNFKNLLTKIEQNARKIEEEDQASKRCNSAFKKKSQSYQTLLEKKLESSEEDDDEEEKDLFSKEISERRSTIDRYKIEANVSEMALSVLNSRQNNTGTYYEDQSQETFNFPTLDQNSVITQKHGSTSGIFNKVANKLRADQTGRNINDASQNLAQLTKQLNKGGYHTTAHNRRQKNLSLPESSILIQKNNNLSTFKQEIGNFDEEKQTPIGSNSNSSKTLSPETGDSESKSKKINHVSFNMQNFTQANHGSKIQSYNVNLMQEQANVATEIQDFSPNKNQNDSILTDTDPLDWEQNFNSQERVELLDLEGAYFNILTQLGNTRAKERAERLYKLIIANKLTWWKHEERQLHEVMGIERAQIRRMKLIMAKLEARINKPKKNSKVPQLIHVKTKKISFTRNEHQESTRQSIPITSTVPQMVVENPMAKYQKFKKYVNLARPKRIIDTLNAAEKFESEKTLEQLQEIVLESLKRKAMRKQSTAFLNDLNARRSLWKEERAKLAEEGPKSDDQMSSVDEVDSVNLSDIKSENESIYWKQKRGSVEAVDVMIANDKLFDKQFQIEFKENLKRLELCLEQPDQALQEFQRADDDEYSSAERRKQKRVALKLAGQN